MKYEDTLTLQQNGGKRVSDDLKFQKFPGEDAIELPLLRQSLIPLRCSVMVTVHIGGKGLKELRRWKLQSRNAMILSHTDKRIVVWTAVPEREHVPVCLTLTWTFHCEVTQENWKSRN